MKQIFTLLSALILINQSLMASTGQVSEPMLDEDLPVEQQMVLLENLKNRVDEANAKVAEARKTLKRGEYVKLGAVAFSIASALGVGYGWAAHEGGKNANPDGIFSFERKDVGKMKRGKAMMKWAVGLAGAGLLAAYLASNHVEIKKADLVMLEKELGQVSVQLANKKRVLKRIYAVDTFLDEEDFEGTTH